MKPAILILVAALALGVATVASAQSTINVTEIIDFSNNSGLPTTIVPTLGTGTNSISGTISLIPSGGVALGDADAFQISNPSLLPILEININIKNFAGVGGQAGSLELLSGIFTFANAVPNGGFISYTNNGLYNLTATISDPSTLLFLLLPPQAGPLSGTYDYTVNIVAGVPEPSTTVLLGGATFLASAVGIVRRRKNSTRA